METYIPKNVTNLKTGPQRFTSNVQHHLNKVHTLCKKAKHSPSEHNKHTLEAAKTTLQELIVSARQSYESALIDQFSKGNSSKIFTSLYLRSLSSAFGSYNTRLKYIKKIISL